MVKIEDHKNRAVVVEKGDQKEKGEKDRLDKITRKLKQSKKHELSYNYNLPTQNKS